MLQRTITITSTQILAIDATPIEIVPAPGAGQYYVPIAVSSVTHFASAAYAAGSQVDLYVGAKANGHSIKAITAAQMNAAANSIEVNSGDPDATPIGVQAQYENQNLNLQAVGAAFTTGDGSITVTVYYNASRTS